MRYVTTNKKLHQALIILVKLKHSAAPAEKVIVKISGDGAKFSKSSQFILLSFSLPFLSSNPLSGYGKLSIIIIIAVYTG